MFKWISGRQQSGYEKLCFLNSKWLKADGYLLKYSVGSKIDWHTDPVLDGYKHYRLNIIFWSCKEGGKFFCEGKSLFQLGQSIIFFRPDIQKHCVTEILNGSRYVLSIGWLGKA